jgi:hypothetical protein
MDATNTFISTGMSAGLYILYKMAQRYYFKSGCHNRTLEITIVDKEEDSKQKEVHKVEPEEEKKEAVIEMANI